MPSIISATTTNGLSTSADNSGSLQLATNNGTTAVTIDTSQNVGIGTASPTAKVGIPVPLYTASSTSGMIRFQNPNVAADGCIQSYYVSGAGTDLFIGTNSYIDTSGVTNRFSNSYASSAINIRRDGDIGFQTNTSAGVAQLRMNITSAGDLLVNGSTVYGKQTNFHNSSYVYASVSVGNNADHIIFKSDATTVGSINRVGGTGVVYNTSSDYRLKENIAPMTGALATVAQLKPVTYNWKVDGSAGQGFIAHELQEVIPEAVSGEKDAVEEDGSIKPQGIDQSRIVATLTAAIQELKAELDATKAEVQALKGVA